ncbi:MAG TPA: hypothetical protein VFE47_16460 [Tepidisphaeraceae bacterium]|jgi:hypothetical protein|nr:hypothetical protein [Tepidisphaeraceae bacterium]
MPQVQLSEQIFQAAERQAAARGYTNVDSYISDFVLSQLGGDSENFDAIFTADQISALEQISADIMAGGKTYTIAEVEEHFRNRRKEWLTNHAT